MVIRYIAIALALLVALPAMADSHTKVVVIPLGDSPFNYANFSGPQRDLKQSLLEAEGWSICYEAGFDSTSSIGSILGPCYKNELMMACRPSDGDNGGFFTLAAYAPRADVTFNTGTSNTTHKANGTEWYYDSSYSWGFAPGGETVNRNTCDYQDVTSRAYRMCIHTGVGNLSSGYRCGLRFTFDNNWERVFLHR